MSSSSITHVVLFQFEEPARENAEAAAERLRAMEGVVQGLASIEVGLDFGGGPRAYDLCLITRHADRAALDAYQADATHGEVKAFIGPIARSAAVVDFEK